MEGINPHDLIAAAARDCAKRWTEEANRSGHHPYAGDAFHRLALALMRRQRLTVPDWNRVRVALACGVARTTIEEQAQQSLYKLAKAGRLTQDPEGSVVTTRQHPEGTIARYWQDHGHTFEERSSRRATAKPGSGEEAGRMEHEQIAAAMRQEEMDCLYDAGLWNAWEA